MNPVHFGSTGSFTLPAAVQLNPGRVLTVRVNSVFSDGRLRISLDGSFFIADRTQNLPTLTEGSEIRAVVLGKDSQGRVVLELVPDAESGLLHRLNLPDSAGFRAITEAFARSGLALDPAALEAGVRRLRTAREDLPFAARLIALLRQKGLPQSLDSSLLPLLSSGDSEDHGDNGGYQKREGGRHNEQSPFSVSGRRKRAAGSTTESRKKLARALSDHLEREPDAVHELHLFNHYRRESPHWTIIPLPVDPFDTVTLALRFDSTGAADMATLRISWNKVRVQSHWTRGSNTVRIATNSARVADFGNSSINRLREALQPLGIHVDTISVSSSLDGFSDEALESILRPFDRNV